MDSKKGLKYNSHKDSSLDYDTSKIKRRFTNPFVDNSMNQWYLRNNTTVANAQGDGYIKMNLVSPVDDRDERPTKRRNLHASFGKPSFGVHHHQNPPMSYRSTPQVPVSRIPPSFGRYYDLPKIDHSLLEFCE